MNMNVETIPAYKIVYVRHVGPYGDSNVQTMESLKSWAKSNNLLNDNSIILGIAQDNPKTTEHQNCRYDTCIVVSDDYSLNDGYMNIGKIEGGNYAVFEISHTAEAVQKAWNEIFAHVFDAKILFDESRPILERYKSKMIKNHLCEICVPIR